MVSDKVNFDLRVDYEDGNNYKSCFARSVAVNSQFKTKSTGGGPQLLHDGEQSAARAPNSAMDPPNPNDTLVRLRKKPHNIIMDENRRLSCSSISSSRRTSICSNRITEIPVENIVNQSKVETLQWQLKEIEKSREMYKAMMKQVVIFLEKAHRSLELFGNKLNTKQTVPRSKSEHQIVTEENSNDDYALFRDLTWRRPKKQELSSEEIPPEKLSQEAFRLLRTVQSLLNTQEPKLALSNSSGPPEDLEFLAQLAREFPPPVEVKPQRTTSFSLSPKLLTPDADVKISTAFNRKLSLQLNETRRNVFKDFVKSPSNHTEFLSSGAVQEKSNSPPGGSISSVEDESGFSSMNSFQDVGLPLANCEEVTAKNALLRSMLHNGDFDCDNNDVKLWQKPDQLVSHQRWNSTPVEKSKMKPNSMKVLWV